MKAHWLIALIIYASAKYVVQSDDESMLSGSCVDDTHSYCINCKAFNLCPGYDNPFVESLIKAYEEPIDGSLVECQDEKVCVQSGTFAYCESAGSVCKCPSSSDVTSFCDPYSDKFVQFCYNGTITEFETCLEANSICYNGSCSKITTLAPGTITEAPIPTCTEEFDVLPKNCTSYYVCSNGELIIEKCLSNQITSYDGSIAKCVDYKQFTCPHGKTGKYRDQYKCNVFYNCQNGNQVGPAQVCNNGQDFDPASQQCSFNVDCQDIRCTPCTNSNLIIPINCFSYFQCKKDETNSYYTEYTECPAGLFFNPETNLCEPQVNGCN